MGKISLVRRELGMLELVLMRLLVVRLLVTKGFFLLDLARLKMALAFIYLLMRALANFPSRIGPHFISS
jgi:hypothetical protein